MMPNPTSPKSPKIGAVVSQAKDTASALWVLLHARHCTDNNCHLLHCSNAKGIFSLSRAASVGTKLTESQSDAVSEARKLLCHYKQCRQSRQTSQGGNPLESPSSKSSTPICLVCSLVARARPMRAAGSSMATTPEPSKTSVENIALDFSSSPYDPSLPAPSFTLSLHGHGTRSGGRRRASSMGSIDESPTARNSRGTFSSLTSRINTNGNRNGSSHKSNQSSNWGLPPTNKRPRSNSQTQRDKKMMGINSSSTNNDNDSGGGGLTSTDANLFAPLLTAASQEDTYGFGSYGNFGNSNFGNSNFGYNHSNNQLSSSTANGVLKSGRNRSASLSNLPLTSEDQLGASVLSSLFSSNQQGGSKRPRSVSWSNELRAQRDTQMDQPPEWILGPSAHQTPNNDHTHNEYENSKRDKLHHSSSLNESSSSSNGITHIADVGHITTFRRISLPMLSPQMDTKSSSSSLGPRSPPTLAKLADAVDRSIHSPTSMLGYIDHHHTNLNQHEMITTTPGNKPRENNENNFPTSPHRELSLMKLADAVHLKQLEGSNGQQKHIDIGPNVKSSSLISLQSPQAHVTNVIDEITAIVPQEGRVSVDLEEKCF